MAYQPYQGNTGGGGGNANGRIAAEMLAKYFLGGASTSKPASSTSDILKLGEGPIAEEAAKSNLATSWMTRLETPKIGQTWNPSNQYLTTLANQNAPANKSSQSY